jgi:polysaccharide pyruvyl transferase WcaK-like protein
MQRKRIRIAFAWQTLTSDNLGVAALAQSQLAIAREAADANDLDVEAIEFCPIGPKLALAKQLGCELADPLSIKKILLGKSRYVSQLRACDVVLDIGAGDSFSDIYGGKHFFFLCFSKWLALWLKKPLIMSPQTMGPFSAAWVKKLASYIMNRATKVFARDDMSMAVLREMGISKNAEEVINVSGLLMSGGYTFNNQFGLTVDYPRHITTLIEALLQKEGVEIHLVGHVLADEWAVEDDYVQNVKLAEKYPQLIIATKFASPSEAKSYISGLDFFTGARMHACIAAFSSGVPVVPAAYSRKFNGLFGALGYKHIADLKADTTEVATAKVLEAFENRAALKLEVAKGNEIAQQKLMGYRQFLRTFFASLPIGGRA